MKDHEIAQFVNELTAAAQKYAETQQLREHIREVVMRHIEREDPDFECWKCGTKDIDEHQRFCPHCGACMS